MKIPFRQLKRYGCCFYALANFLNDEQPLNSVVKDRGGFIVDMNTSLNEIQPGYFLTAMFVCNSGLDVQNRFYDNSLFGLEREEIPGEILKNHFRPFFMSVKMAFVHHMILVIENLETGLFYVFNSLFENSETYTKEEFVLKYWVTEVYCIENEYIKQNCTYGAPALFLSFPYDMFTHLKPE